jgi:hypothetical protein
MTLWCKPTNRSRLTAAEFGFCHMVCFRQTQSWSFGYSKRLGSEERKMVASTERRAQAEESLAQADRGDSSPPSALEAFMALAADFVDCAADSLGSSAVVQQPQQIRPKA